MRVVPAVTPRATASRLVWSIIANQEVHRVEVRPSSIGGHVAIYLDGKPALQIRKPSTRCPSSEASLSVEGTEITILLRFAFPAMDVDVFVDGVSARDGQLLAAVQPLASLPVSRYEAWVNIRTAPGVSPTEFAPSWFRLAFAICIVTIATGLTVLRTVSIDSRPPGLLAVVVASLGVVGIGLLAIRTWLVATERVHRYLLQHPKFGDLRRLMILIAIFVGLPVAAGAIVVGTLAAIDGLTR
jgi:hypothetical protein